MEPGSALRILNPKLAALLDKALAAVKVNDLVLALKYFGECAEIDPTNKAVLYFGSDAAQRAYFSLRYADPLPEGAKVNEWREAAMTLTMACHWADPNDPIALHNVGRFLHDDGQDAEAIEWYQKALRLKRDQVESWGNLGTCLYTLGDVQGGELAWSKCVAFEATNPSGHLSQGYVWLRRGDYLRGWKALNARWEDQTFQASYGRPDLGGKMWTGQPLKKGDTLLVHGEQGLGDHVQFARYIPELIARKIRVVGLETRAPLKRWMEACLPDVPVFVRDTDRLPNYTHHVPMMSLPGLLGMEEFPPPLKPASLHWRGCDDISNSVNDPVASLAEPKNVEPVLAVVPLPVVSLDRTDGATLGTGVGPDDQAVLDGIAERSVREVLVSEPEVRGAASSLGRDGVTGGALSVGSVAASATPAAQVEGLAVGGREIGKDLEGPALGATLGCVGVDGRIESRHDCSGNKAPQVPCKVITETEKRNQRVGIIFKGTTGNPIDNQRSIPDHLLAELADTPGVTWVPLQYGAEADLTARAWLGKSVEASPAYKDVLELAEIMASLDMVVAVDTLGAHVAGSVGVPTLLLHRHNREWRWGQHSETTGWYPSVSQLTQAHPVDWAGLLLQTRARLQGRG